MGTDLIGHRFGICALSIFFLLSASMAAMGLPQVDPEVRPAGGNDP